MLFYENQESCLLFYRKCEKFVKSKNYSKELLAEFPSWALLHYSEKRSRVDFLFIDFLRQELGRRNSERNLFLLNGANIMELELSVNSDAENYCFVNQCLSEFDGLEKAILSYYFIEGYSFDEISKIIDISKSGVKQKLDSSIKKLRDRADISG